MSLLLCQLSLSSSVPAQPHPAPAGRERPKESPTLQSPEQIRVPGELPLPAPLCDAGGSLPPEVLSQERPSVARRGHGLVTLQTGSEGQEAETLGRGQRHVCGSPVASPGAGLWHRERGLGQVPPLPASVSSSLARARPPSFRARCGAGLRAPRALRPGGSQEIRVGSPFPVTRSHAAGEGRTGPAGAR